jgi:hypothetical protein
VKISTLQGEKYECSLIKDHQQLTRGKSFLIGSFEPWAGLESSPEGSGK